MMELFKRLLGPVGLLVSLIIMLSIVIARQNNVEGTEDISEENISELTTASFWVFIVYLLISMGVVGFVLYNTEDTVTTGMGAITYTFVILALALFSTAYWISNNNELKNDVEAMELSNNLVKSSFAFIVIYSIFSLSTIVMGTNTEEMFVERVKQMRSPFPKLPFLERQLGSRDLGLSSYFGRRKRGRKSRR